MCPYFSRPQMLIEAAGFCIIFEYPKEKTFIRNFGPAPRNNLAHEPGPDALALKLVTDMQIVEHGSQLWIGRAKGTGKSSQLLPYLSQHNPLPWLWLRQPLSPKSVPFANEVAIQILVAKQASIRQAPTGCMESCDARRIALRGISNLHKTIKRGRI